MHLKKEHKEKEKKSKVVPLVTEGLQEAGKGRKQTKTAMDFVDEKFDIKALWRSIWKRSMTWKGWSGSICMRMEESGSKTDLKTSRM